MMTLSPPDYHDRSKMVGTAAAYAAVQRRDYKQRMLKHHRRPAISWLVDKKVQSSTAQRPKPPPKHMRAHCIIIAAAGVVVVVVVGFVVGFAAVAVVLVVVYTNKCHTAESQADLRDPPSTMSSSV